MDSKEQLVLICPEAKVTFKEGKLFLIEKFHFENEPKCEEPTKYMPTMYAMSGVSYISCRACKGKSHEELVKTRPFKHPFHPKHFLIFVLYSSKDNQDSVTSRKCFCCKESLNILFYCCLSCDFAMNLFCVKKSPIFVIDNPKRHEHTLSLFPRQTSLTCNVCALDDSSCPIYICPPCDFVVHQSCIDLPWVIKISRHLHRISFTSSFVLQDLICNICRKKIDNDYGGYSCKKKDCSYVVHSKCATRKNVWDGKELEGEPEEIEEEEVEPFVRISTGIIKHFSHDHHLSVDENNDDRAYDENKYCQICNMPIFYGNFYACLQCDFILHKTCANLPRRKYHPIHPHKLYLQLEDEKKAKYFTSSSCSACIWPCFGYFYKCNVRRCNFQLDVQCATLSEPLIHESHMDPLFLTMELAEHRKCSICHDHISRRNPKEMFNCIKCDFTLCFKCATLPHKVRYKHDKHLLTLSYGEKIDSTMLYWCEICEKKLDFKQRFYTCDDCCVTLHVTCLLGTDFNMSPGLSIVKNNVELIVKTNSSMTRPICISCKRRCPYNVLLQDEYGSTTFCSYFCVIVFGIK